MRFPKFRRIRRRVAVVGLYRAGKTVFLTSFINHLQKHDPDRLPLGKDGRTGITFKQELPPEDGFESFAYLEHRNRLADVGGWPRKTRATSQYRCEFYRSDWRLSRGELAMLDLPGERLADIWMAGCTYEAWSDLILRMFRDHVEYQVCARRYLDLLGEPTPTEDRLIDTYRRTLAELFLSFRPVISPSTFILQENGRFVADQAPDRRFEESFVGLDRENQFVPLCDEVRRREPALTSVFADRYAHYRDQVVRPLAEWMKSCEELVVLVDVTTLLAGGLGMYEGNRELLKRLLEYLNPGLGFWDIPLEVLKTLLKINPWQSLLGDFLNPTKRKIRRVAFVATKADKVHESQRQKVLFLLRDMVRDLIDTYVEGSMSLDVQYFVCSAVKSTCSTADGRLQAYLPRNEALQEFTPSEVPGEWPPDWRHGEYCYPDVAPWMPPRRDAPPEHLELNRVVDFLLRG